MKTTTLAIKTAIYRNGPYALYGYRSAKTGQFSVSMTKGHGRSIKWIEHNRFGTQEEAVHAFIDARSRLDALVTTGSAQRANGREERSSAIATYKETTPNPWKVGDLAYTSWGYEQTNVELYQVIEVKSRTKMVVAPICGENVDTHYMQGKVRAIKDAFTSKPSIEISAGFSFYKYGKTVSELWSVRGHSLSRTNETAWHHYSSYA
jgi:hypothetical protein